MNIMVDLSKVWNAKSKISLATSDESVVNPLLYFEEAFHYVRNLIVQAYKSRNCTYAEFLEEVRKIDPGIVTRYFELSDAVDCDVYGKWCSSILTVEEYNFFCKTVEEWKHSASKMVITIERRS
jgi:hypothetical protein